MAVGAELASAVEQALTLARQGGADQAQATAQGGVGLSATVRPVAEVIGRCYKNYQYNPTCRVWEPEGEGEKIHLLAMEPVAISSTEIRQRVRAGLPLDEWVPPAVAKYIFTHGLYT